MVEACAHLAGPVIMGTAYSAFVKTNPSMPFYIAAAGLFAGFTLVCTIKADKPTNARTASDYETDVENV
jgi:lipid-binding SYLF domain-containing protein